MLDISFIRENPDKVKQAMRHKGEDNPEVVDEVLSVDEQWRSLVEETDNLRNESNTKAKKIGQLMGEGKKEKAQKIIEHTSKLKEGIQQKEEELRTLKNAREDLLLQIPNIPHESVPVGQTEDDNEVFKSWGDPDKEEWRKPHWKSVVFYR